MDYLLDKNNLKFGQSIDYLRNLENERNNLKGKKRKPFDDLSNQNKRKLLRNSGQQYVNTSNDYKLQKFY